jgi:hypothetical protein
MPIPELVQCSIHRHQFLEKLENLARIKFASCLITEATFR